MAVLEGKVEREREYIFLCGYLSAEMRGNPTKDRVQTLRLAVLMFLESVIILDSAIAQLAADRLNAQPVLFRDCSVKLEEQLKMAEEMSEHFNLLARGALKKGTAYYIFDFPKGSNTGAEGINDNNVMVGHFTPAGKTLAQPYQGPE